ncbi:TetR/AcrR family transcriptional regulator [Streptomyces sp. NBC_01016]|uniref:TetR/AcrR family transcriptional regulator n=1 Tax=Streptomyces sp. NBC_01016 TaxID=2903720 RepID=UPI002256CBAE|nr:TetR/AcrR family transcriptional regulator [Streptomyces sp. NBC_01016]MCX4831337.1 TetR/AcrR family transcriptional regulator [Streptomyces sp. NBC_01016]
MSQAKARGPYAKTAARRAEIVRAARDCFAEHGFTKASLRGIAERAGITHAGLLHHFQNKDDLLAAVLADRDTEEWQYGESQVADMDELGPYLGELLRHHQKSPELTRLWLELAAAAARPDHPAHAYFTERYEVVRTNFAQGMHGKAERGELHAGLAPEHAATLLQAVLNGLQLQWLLDHDLDIVGPVRAFLDLLFQEATEAD